MGQLLAYEGDFGDTLAPFWGHFGATLGIWTSNGRYDGCSCEFDGAIVRPKRAHKQQIHILPTYFACHRGARRRQENEHVSEPAHFEVTLGSLWGHFGVTWGQFRYLWVTLGQLMVTLQ